MKNNVRVRTLIMLDTLSYRDTDQRDTLRKTRVLYMLYKAYLDTTLLIKIDFYPCRKENIKEALPSPLFDADILFC